MLPRPHSRVEVLQGTLDFLILQTLRWGPQHGYGMVQMIRATSRNALMIETGSMYPALHRLEGRKWIAAKWEVSEHGQRVRVYRLTAAGKKQLAVEKSRWQMLTEAVESLTRPPLQEGES